MKITNLVYTVLVSSILIFSPSLSLSQAHFTTAPVGEATPLPDGFCCTNGQVISTSQAQCKKRGQYYQTRVEALRHCRQKNIFCCINGKVSKISPEQCKRSQGTAYGTASEAKKKCKPKAIYCCLNGKIVKVSPKDCKKNRGTAYATSSEAKRKCKPEEVYCCLKGKIKKTSPEECKKNRGTIYRTTAEAKKKCKPEAVYCCLKGSIKKTSSTECKTKKGAPYRTEREARKNCGWCCAESKVLPITLDVCKRKRGKYFTSKVQADQQCKEQPQCCVAGKLVLYSQLECKRNKGQYYRSHLEAKRRCRVVVGNLRPEVSRTGKPLKATVLRPNIPGKGAPPRPNPDPPPPPPPPEPDTFLLHPIEAIPFFNVKGYDSFQVNSVQFAKVIDPGTNQTHIAAAVVFNQNIDAATVQENINIRLLKQNEETTFWSDVSTQNNVLRIGPNFISWLSGAQIANGNYKMHLRGTVESESGDSLDCDGDGVGEGGALPAYDSQIYQVNEGLIEIDPGEIRDNLLDLLTISDTVSTPDPVISITSPAQGDFMAEGGQFVLQWSVTGNIPEKCVNIHLFKGALHEMAIAHNVCINGYSWQLPQGLSGTGYTIRIRTVDNAYSDTSDPFSILSAQPDLRISNFHIQSAPPNTLDDITVRGTIQNAGHGTSASTNAVIRLQTTYSSSNYFGERTVTIPSLVFGPNAHMNFSETFAQPFGNEGAISSGWTYMQPAQAFELLATVEVDSQNLVTEADEGNNSAEIVFTPTPLPNLRAQPLKNDIYAAALFPVSIVFTVRNYSSVPVGPTVCRTWIEDRGHENHNVPALNPGKDYIFARSVTFALAGWRNVSFTVDHGNMVAEFSEDDNIVTGRFHVNTTRPFGL